MAVYRNIVVTSGEKHERTRIILQCLLLLHNRAARIGAVISHQRHGRAIGGEKDAEQKEAKDRRREKCHLFLQFTNSLRLYKDPGQTDYQAIELCWIR